MIDSRQARHSILLNSCFSVVTRTIERSQVTRHNWSGSAGVDVCSCAHQLLSDDCGNHKQTSAAGICCYFIIILCVCGRVFEIIAKDVLALGIVLHGIVP